MLTRRGLLAGLGVALCAPAIIRTPGLLMPVKPLWHSLTVVAQRPFYDPDEVASFLPVGPVTVATVCALAKRLHAAQSNRGPEGFTLYVHPSVEAEARAVFGSPGDDCAPGEVLRLGGFRIVPAVS
jgi:hypothetical protein